MRITASWVRVCAPAAYKDVGTNIRAPSASSPRLRHPRPNKWVGTKKRDCQVATSGRCSLYGPFVQVR
jgi:hypothetical protein